MTPHAFGSRHSLERGMRGMNPRGCPIDAASPNWPDADAAGVRCGDVFVDNNTIQDIGLFSYCGVRYPGLVPAGVCTGSPAGYPQGIIRPLMLGMYPDVPFTYMRNNVIHNVP
jgi:hypothetical protein